MSFFKKLFGQKTEEEKKEQLDKGLEKTKSGFFDKIKKAVAGKSTVEFLSRACEPCMAVCTHHRLPD